MTYTDDLVDERIRAAVPRDDDSNWRDVRRRARRKQAPAALAAGAIVAALLAAPAFAFRDQIADWWGTSSPERGEFVKAVAECGQGNFTLSFHPEGGAVVRQGEQTLARASLTEREIECDAPIRLVKSTPAESPYHGALDGRSYGATRVRCVTNVPLEIMVNPVWYEDETTGSWRVIGSSLLVAERETKRSIASAVFKRGPTDGRNWSRTYWNPAVCSART